MDLDSGMNVFESTSRFEVGGSNQYVFFSGGLEESVTSMDVVFRGYFSVNHYLFTAYSSWNSGLRCTQEAGSDVRVKCIDMGAAKRYTNDLCWDVQGGSLTVSENISVSEPANWAATDSKRTPRFKVTGGNAWVKKLTLSTASAELSAGKLTIDSGGVSFGTDCRLFVSGGELAMNTGAPFNPSEWPQISWTGTSRLGSSSGVVWDWTGVDIAADAVVIPVGVISGLPSRFAPTRNHMMSLEVPPGNTFDVPEGTSFVPASDETAPWQVSVADNGVLMLDNGSFNGKPARLSLPLDLTLGSGATLRAQGRGTFVAHRLTVSGVEQPKGRYTSDVASWIVDARATSKFGYGVTVLVPYVWTGAGDGTNWSDAVNWEGNAVPPANACVDFSRATKDVVVGSDVTVQAIVYMPSAERKSLALSGAGAITFDNKWGCSVLYVADDAELVVDTVAHRQFNVYTGFAGGGRFVFTRSAFQGVSAPDNGVGVDGTVVFRGKPVVDAPLDAASATRFYYGGYENCCVPDIELRLDEDDSSYQFTVGDFYALNQQKDGCGDIGEIRQYSGRFKAKCLYLNNDIIGHEGFRSSRFRLFGGELALQNYGAHVMLNGRLSGGDGFYRGGCFEMSGGKVEGYGFESMNLGNFVNCNGGVIRCPGGFVLTVYGDDQHKYCKETSFDEHAFHFGGVTFNSYQNNTPSWSSGNGYLTGVNGNLKFDCFGRFTIASGVRLAGIGGLETTVRDHFGALVVNANCEFTGPIVADGGPIEIGASATLNGPRELRVSNPSAYTTITIASGATITKSPEVIELTAPSQLCLNDAAICLHVKRFVVAGAVQPVGTYEMTGGGSVVVDGEPAFWLSGIVGDASYLADGGTAALEADTTLGRLVYTPFGAAGTVTVSPSADETLTFSDGAVLEVSSGSTLVIDAAVVLAGAVRKTGDGRVVFAKTVSQTGVGVLTVDQGAADFQSAVVGATVLTAGAYSQPVVTLTPGCTVSGGAKVQTAWSSAAKWGYVSGKTVQNGAAVSVSGDYVLSNPQGGEAAYDFNGGSIAATTLSGCAVTVNGTATFDGVRIANALVNGQDGKLSLSGTCSFAGAVDKTLELDIPSGAKLALDGDLFVDRLYWNGLERAAGVYQPGVKKVGKNALTGKGSLIVANGTGPGVMILIR